jgi:hypothetical protein
LAEHEDSSLYAMRFTICRNITSFPRSIDTSQILVTGIRWLSAKMDETLPTGDEREAGGAGNLNSAAFERDIWAAGGSFHWSHVPNPHDIPSQKSDNGNMAVNCMGAYDPATRVL